MSTEAGLQSQRQRRVWGPLGAAWKTIHTSSNSNIHVTAPHVEPLSPPQTCRIDPGELPVAVTWHHRPLAPLTLPSLGAADGNPGALVQSSTDSQREPRQTRSSAESCSSRSCRPPDRGSNL